MENEALKQLGMLGQSLWLDYIRRDLLTSGGLQRMIDEDELRGLTSNPAIFEKAISGSQLYDEAWHKMAHEGRSPKAIYEALSMRDVQEAAVAFWPVYERTGGRDGYVSLEVDPHLAYDTQGTVEEARRLWASLNQPNVLIKVPATDQGLPAIRTLISEGINVNVTLIFGSARYRQVAEAYLAGIEARRDQGKAVRHVASVASFFVSRIDALADPLLAKLIAGGGERAELAQKALGQVAIVTAKLAYQAYQEIFGGERFRHLAAQGARAQRLLWASTGTKDPAYSDIKYVEALVGPDTVSTVPLETLNAYRDHGQPKAWLQQDMEEARWLSERLPGLGLDLDALARQLEEQGVKKFQEPFDHLMHALR